MIVGQYIAFAIAPDIAYGVEPRTNIYVPVIIATVAGLGGAVRFYRTVILNEINQDYVRTARAKGVPLPSILFRHVLKNCMLPILTNLVLSIPFLILGSLLLESFFGIPGLGDLMVSSIRSRDVPIINGLTFLTALIYTLGLLLTDILYAVFDPRIRLQ
jgi:peptide/nickel transport system permease protein